MQSLQFVLEGLAALGNTLSIVVTLEAKPSTQSSSFKFHTLSSVLKLKTVYTI